MLFYTVRIDREGFPVKYIDPNNQRVQTFSGSFADPGEASQEFQNRFRSLGLEFCFLESAAFQGKARAFSRLRAAKVSESKQF